MREWDFLLHLLGERGARNEKAYGRWHLFVIYDFALENILSSD